VPIPASGQKQNYEKEIDTHIANSLNKRNNSNSISPSINLNPHKNPIAPIIIATRDMDSLTSSNISPSVNSLKTITNSPLEAVKQELEKHAKIQNKTLTLTPLESTKDDSKIKLLSHNSSLVSNELSSSTMNNSSSKKIPTNLNESGTNSASSINKSRALSPTSSSSSRASFLSNKSGFIQINEKVYPYVSLFDYGYRCISATTSQGSSKYPICFKYVSVKQLVESKIIPIDLYNNKNEMAKHFKTFRQAQKEFMHIFNEQILKLERINYEASFVMFSDTLELVNLVELYINFSNKALYLQEIELENIPRKILTNYERVLSFTGGILQYKSPNNKKKQILPFIDFEDKKLVISTSIKIALQAYAQTADNDKNDLNMDFFELNSEKLSFRDVTDFFKLILTYICIDNAKFNSSMKLIDIQKWLTIFPQKLNILCCFTSKFPIDWIEAFNRNEPSMIVLLLKVI
jgi:hypothetical protein